MQQKKISGTYKQRKLVYIIVIKYIFLYLVDTRGKELDQNYSIINVWNAADQFTHAQLNKNDINEVVHCIWYYIESIRL